MVPLAAAFVVILALISPSRAAGYQDAKTCFTLINEGGNLESAVIHCTRALDSRDLRSQHLAPVYYNRGWAYDALGDYQQAIADFGQAIHYRPDYVLAYVARGYSYVQVDELDLAIADYTRALEIDPNSFEARFNRGLAYEQKGDLTNALADYEAAQSLRPDEPRLRSIMQRLLRQN